MTREDIHRRSQAMHAPLSIKLNGTEFQIGQPLPANIEYLNISCGVFAPTVQQHQIPLVKKWLNEVVDAFTGTHATYNGILVPKNDIVKFTL